MAETKQVKEKKKVPAKKVFVKSKYSRSENRTSMVDTLPYNTKGPYYQNTKNQVQQFNKEYKVVSDVAKNTIDMMLDPFVCNNCPLLPTGGGLCSNYKAVDNIETPTAGTLDEILVIVRPTISEAIMVTYGANHALNIADAGNPTSGAFIPYIKQRFCTDENDSTFQISSLLQLNGGHICVPQPSAAETSFIYWFRPQAIPASGSSSVQVELTIPTYAAAACYDLKLLVEYHDADGDILLTKSVNIDPLAGKGTLKLFDGTMPDSNDVEGFSFAIQPSVGPDFGRVLNEDIILSFVCENASPLVNSTWTAPINTHNCVAYDINGASQIENTAEGYFVSAQSLLVTYSGSSLNNSGRGAIAKLNKGTALGQQGGDSAPQSNSIYQFLASLPKNNYSGPSKRGFYAFYLPDNIYTDYQYSSTNDDNMNFDKSYIAAVFSTDADNPQPFRLQITTIVQFLSNSTTFKYEPAPFMGEDYYKIMHILSVINSCYENESHREKLTQALKATGAKIMQVLRNPNTYQTMAKIAALLL